MVFSAGSQAAKLRYAVKKHRQKIKEKKNQAAERQARTDAVNSQAGEQHGPESIFKNAVDAASTAENQEGVSYPLHSAQPYMEQGRTGSQQYAVKVPGRAIHPSIHPGPQPMSVEVKAETFQHSKKAASPIKERVKGSAAPQR